MLWKILPNLPQHPKGISKPWKPVAQRWITWEKDKFPKSASCRLGETPAQGQNTPSSVLNKDVQLYPAWAMTHYFVILFPQNWGGIKVGGNRMLLSQNDMSAAGGASQPPTVSHLTWQVQMDEDFTQFIVNIIHIHKEFESYSSFLYEIVLHICSWYVYETDWPWHHHSCWLIGSIL